MGNKFTDKRKPDFGRWSRRCDTIMKGFELDSADAQMVLGVPEIEGQIFGCIQCKGNSWVNKAPDVCPKCGGPVVVLDVVSYKIRFATKNPEKVFDHLLPL